MFGSRATPGGSYNYLISFFPFFFFFFFFFFFYICQLFQWKELWLKEGSSGDRPQPRTGG